MYTAYVSHYFCTLSLNVFLDTVVDREQVSTHVSGNTVQECRRILATFFVDHFLDTSFECVYRLENMNLHMVF